MKDILIIGAGACGLMAASNLVMKHRVTLIEARDRVGGRIHTIHSMFSLPVEAGAEFMHGHQPLTASLIKSSGTEASLLTGKRYQIWNHEPAEGDLFDADWGRLTEALQALKADTDMATFLKDHFNSEGDRTLREKVRSFVEGFDAADMDQVSALALREEWSEGDDEHQYQIVDGYGRLTQHLAAEVKRQHARLLLSTIVSGIRWRKGRVEVITSTGNILEGEKVIVTVPLGVLKNGSIRFTPPLSGHAQAFEKMGFGGVIKVFAEFKNPFWQDRIARPLKDPAFIFSDAEIPTWWTQRPRSETVLTGWLGGPSTRRIPHDRDVLVEKATRSLQYIFQCSARDIDEQAEQWHVENWCVDPFAGGAYAYPTVNTSQALNHISKPVEETIYFAGEAMYSGSAIGTVEAALINGQQVANEMDASLSRRH